MKIIPWPIALLIGLTLTISCEKKKEPVQKQAFSLTDTMMNRIRMEPVRTQTVRNQLRLVGKVAADENKVIEVFPLVGGNVEDVFVELGDYVRQGQKLAVIRSGEIADYERQMIEAKANLQLAQKNLRVAQEMNESKLNSQRDVLQAQQQVEQAEAELGRVQAVFRIYGVGKSAGYIVKAPIAGFVIEKKINRNTQLRSDNAENLFTIGQISDVLVLASVNESDINRVHTGMDASIQTLTYPDELFRGKVDKIYNVIDASTKAMTVRIKLPNKGLKLKPEMHATVMLNFDEGGQMAAIPAGAIIFDKSKSYVMVYHDRKHIDTREVQVYRSLGDVAYVSRGIKPGERVITQNQLLIYDALND